VGGTLNVTNFAFTLVSSSGVTLADTDITVTPFIFASDRYGLTFSSPVFTSTITGTEFANFEIDYTWDPNDIRSLEDVLDTSTPVAPGFVTVTTMACEGFAFSGITCSGPSASLTVSHDGITPHLFASVSFPDVSTLGIRDIVAFNANGGSSEFRSFTNTVVTPEPSTLTAGLTLIVLAFTYRLRGRTVPTGTFLD
jgi:hypothetical protein